jgi:hypothetical protein
MLKKQGNSFLCNALKNIQLNSFLRNQFLYYRFVLLSEIITTYSGNITKPITTVCGQNVKFLNANVVRKVKAKLSPYLIKHHAMKREVEPRYSSAHSECGTRWI